jgi:hypothetical protein
MCLNSEWPSHLQISNGDTQSITRQEDVMTQKIWIFTTVHTSKDLPTAIDTIMLALTTTWYNQNLLVWKFELSYNFCIDMVVQLAVQNCLHHSADKIVYRERRWLFWHIKPVTCTMKTYEHSHQNNNCFYWNYPKTEKDIDTLDSYKINISYQCTDEHWCHKYILDHTGIQSFLVYSCIAHGCTLLAWDDIHLFLLSD